MMFFTRLPVPSFTDHSPQYLKQSPRYFPLVGALVGAIALSVFLLFHRFLSLELSILASMIASVLTTGAFHEDGFADVCDGFGGGWTKEKILEIMKDSRLGTYGTIGLLFMLGSKFLLLRELLGAAGAGDSLLVVAGCFLMPHAVSRLMSVLSIQLFPYVSEEATSKSKPSAAQKLSTGSLLTAAFFAAATFLLLPPLSLLVLPICGLATVWLNLYFRKWIGGHTGDCLGSVQQITEVLCYFFLLTLWNYT
jgi:adenosylcobinamide-GDP ribazoletransferase